MQQCEGAKSEQKETSIMELKAKFLPPYDAGFDNASEEKLVI